MSKKILSQSIQNLKQDIENDKQFKSAVYELIITALSINDKLNIKIDNVKFEGSMNDAENFREVVNYFWNKWNEELSHY